MMPETRPLCTDAELNLGDRIWGEIEKNIKKNCFIALPGKGGTQWAPALENCVYLPRRIF